MCPSRSWADAMRWVVASSGRFTPGAARVLAQAVLSGLEAQPGDRVADLYAGAGLFAALVGVAVGRSGSVLAVERDRWACADGA